MRKHIDIHKKNNHCSIANVSNKLISNEEQVTSSRDHGWNIYAIYQEIYRKGFMGNT